MELSGNRIAKFTVMLVFLICMLFANFYAVRKIMAYGLDIYFYDRLLVAYNIGGREGLIKELGIIRSADKMPRERALARNFAVDLEDLKDPGIFLSDKVARDKDKVNFIRNLRSAAIILMLFIFVWRLMAGLPRRLRK